MESTLRWHLEKKAVQDGLPPALTVPDPNLDESPLYIDAGDRQVCVLQAMYNPRVVVFGGLLSDEECDGLIALAKPRLARSLTVATKTGGEEVNADRTSNGMFFQRGEAIACDARAHYAMIKKLEEEYPEQRRSRPFKLLYGSEFALEGFRLVAIARDLQGWGGLCEFITAARTRRPAALRRRPP